MRFSFLLLTLSLFLHNSLGVVRWVSPVAQGNGDGNSPENASSDVLAALTNPAVNLTVNFLPGEYSRAGNFGGAFQVYLSQSAKMVSTQLHAATIGCPVLPLRYEIHILSNANVEIKDMRIDGAVNFLIVTAGGSATLNNTLLAKGNVHSAGNLRILDSSLSAPVFVTGGNTEIRSTRLQSVTTTPVAMSVTASVQLYDNVFQYFGTSTSPHPALSTTSGVTLSLGGNSFYNLPPISSSCGSGSDFTITHSNTFCGSGIDLKLNNINDYCLRWNELALESHYDGCFVCGSRENAAKDCTGTCWGTATNCPAPKEIYVSVSGGGDGSRENPTDFTQALAQSAYGDSILFHPGQYTGYNFQLPGNKALTFASLQGDPTTVVWESFTIVSNRTSFDTVLKGITFTTALSVKVHNPDGLKFENCIFRNITQGTNTRIVGGFIWIEDSFFLNNVMPSSDSAFIEGDGDTVQKNLVSLKVDNIVTKNNVGLFFRAAYVALTLEINNWASVGNKGGSLGPTSMHLTPVYSSDISIQGFHSSGSTTGSQGEVSAIFCHVITCASDLSIANSYVCGSNTVNWNSWVPTAGPLDSCGVCGGAEKFKDCGGECFGYKKEDHDNGCCLPSLQDCNGICEGSSALDENGNCCVGTFDCAGECNGPRVLDSKAEPQCCLPSQLDCNDHCFGEREDDLFGGCCLSSELNCAGRCGDSFVLDNSPEPICCLQDFLDCNQICNGTHREDANQLCCEGEQIDLCGSCGTCAPTTESTVATEVPTSEPTAATTESSSSSVAPPEPTEATTESSSSVAPTEETLVETSSSSVASSQSTEEPTTESSSSSVASSQSTEATTETSSSSVATTETASSSAATETSE